MHIESLSEIVYFASSCRICLASNGLPLVFAAQADVDELERLISHYQQIEEDEQGDLLDDFVLSATLVRLPFVRSRSTHVIVPACHFCCAAQAQHC